LKELLSVTKVQVAVSDKHDLSCTVESKKLRASCSLRAVRLVSPARNRVLKCMSAGKNAVESSFLSALEVCNTRYALCKSTFLPFLASV